MPFLLIAKQPDLGTAATLVPVGFGIAYLAGLRLRFIGIALCRGRSAGADRLELRAQGVSEVADRHLSSTPSRTRGARVTSPSRRASRVGSGGLTGKGFMKGTQGQYKFLPVAHNDFIFSVLAEEKGFLGVLAALGLYLFVILRSIEAARMAKDRIGAYLVGGLICGFCVPGDLQHYDVGRPRAGQGFDVAPDELRGVVDDCHARRRSG